MLKGRGVEELVTIDGCQNFAQNVVYCLQKQLWVALYRLVQELLRKTVSAGVRGYCVHVSVVLYLHLKLNQTHLLQLIHLLYVADVLAVVRSDVDHHSVQLHLVEVVLQLLFYGVTIHLWVLLRGLDHLRDFLIGLEQSVDENTRIRKDSQELLGADVLVLNVQIVELPRHLRHLLRHLQA